MSLSPIALNFDAGCTVYQEFLSTQENNSENVFSQYP